MKINKYGRQMMQLREDHHNCTHLWNGFIIHVILCCCMVRVRELGNGLCLIYLILQFGQSAINL
jgi:hypothetical protein